MAKIGTAILEIRTDTGQFSVGLAGARQDIRQLGVDVTATSKLVSGIGKTLATAFTIGAVITAGKQVLDFAGEVTDLSKRLSVSTTTIQQWKGTFGAAGVELETVAKASEQLSLKLTSGDTSAVGALEKMGVSIEALQRMKPEDRFIAVADAVGQIADADEKLYASKALFGKGGAEMLAALDGHLRETIDRMSELGLVIDEETIAAADDFGDQLGFMGQQLLGIVATVIGPLLPALSALGNVLSWLGRNIIGPVLNTAVKSAMTLLAGFWEVISGLLARLADLAAKLPGVGGKFAELSTWLKSSSASAGQYMVSLWESKDATEGAGNAAAVAAPKLLGLGEASAKAAPKHKQQADEIGKLTARINELNAANAAPLFIPEPYIPQQGDVPELGPLRDYMEALERAKGVEADLGRRGAAGIENLGQVLTQTTPVVAALGDSLKASLGNFVQTGLGPTIIGALQGGGDVLQSAGGSLGSVVGTGLLKKVGGKLAEKLGSTIGGAVGSVIPVVGTMIGALGGKLIGGLVGKIFGNPEKEINPIREAYIQAAGGLGAIAQKALEAGVNVDALLKAKNKGELEAAIKDLDAAFGAAAAKAKLLEQSASKYGPTRAQLAEMATSTKETFDYMLQSGLYTQTQLNAAYRDWQQAMADAGNEAAKAWIAAQDAAVTGGAAASEALAELKAQRESLAQSIADEAPEEVMGVIEAQTRGQMAALDAQIEDQQVALAAQADAAADDLEEALTNIDPGAVHVPVVWDIPPLPGGQVEAPEGVPGVAGVTPMAAGGFGTVSRPTLFLAGEAGPEQFAFSGANQVFSGANQAMTETFDALLSAMQDQGATFARVLTSQLARTRLRTA